MHKFRVGVGLTAALALAGCETLDAVKVNGMALNNERLRRPSRRVVAGCARLWAWRAPSALASCSQAMAEATAAVSAAARAALAVVAPEVRGGVSTAAPDAGTTPVGATGLWDY